MLVAKCYPVVMGQPVKLSDALILDARLMGEASERSLAGQIEFWAGLGKVVDSLLRSKDVLALKRSEGVKPLSECLAEVESPEGRQKLKEFLLAGPFPHYEAAEGKSGWLLRTEADGTRTVGRFVKRQFVKHPDEA